MLSFKDIKFLMKNKKARDMQGLFVAEGPKLFLEAPPRDVAQVLFSRRFAEEHPECLSRISPRTEVIADIDEGRFASLSDTRTPQGVIAVVRKPCFDRGRVLSSACPLLVLLENLQDPGNAGTILRTAEAAGATGVFLTEGSVDLYSPKAARSTMGSIYRVPHFYVRDAAEFLGELASRGIVSYAAHLMGQSEYTDCSYRSGTAFVIGNEGSGLTDGAAEAAGVRIRIPMLGKVESLNAAMAAGVLLYEAQRQRRRT